MIWDRLQFATKADLRRLEKKMSDANQNALNEIAEAKTDFTEAVTELAGEIDTLNININNLKAEIAAGLAPSPAVASALADLVTAGQSAKAAADAKVAALNPLPPAA